ncbi:MAG: apolipoprotein N-acyltransferase [Candidatus Omnitrophica bacterium]|nr:apolipoprotein N-acyltransferase [Candidatus Omnitrophota bacterium]
MAFAAVIVSALVYSLSYPSSISTLGFASGGWLFAIPFLLVLRGKPLKQRLWLGALWGFVAYGVHAASIMPISLVGWLAFVLSLTIQPILFAALCRRCQQDVPTFSARVRALFYIPSAWAASEFCRNCFLGAFTWSLADSQAWHPSMIQAAQFGGVYAVSWIMMFVNAALYFWISGRASGQAGKRTYLFMLAAVTAFSLNLIGGACIVSVFVRPESGVVRLATIQANISKRDKMDPKKYDDNVARHLIQTKKALINAWPDLIVWPETALSVDIMKDIKWGSRIYGLAGQDNTSFLFGTVRYEEEEYYNSVLLLSPVSGWREEYHKKKLVPFCEYPLLAGVHPFFKTWSAFCFLSGTRSGIMDLDAGFARSFKPAVRFGTALCSEEAYPGLFRDMARQGAGFFVVLLNDGWFTWPESFRIHAAMGALRAVETGRPYIRAANSGLTIAFDGHGRVINGKAPILFSEGYGLFDISPRYVDTWYVRFGDIFAWLCVIFVIISIGVRVSLKRRRKYPECTSS